MASDAEILEALDFTPEPPRCECPQCMIHPGHSCTEFATYYSEVHLIGECNRPGLTPGGGAVRLLCQGCIIVHARKAGQLIHGSRRVARITGSFLECQTCGRPLAAMTDVIDAKPLNEVEHG